MTASVRPALDLGGSARAAAVVAVDRLVSELQAGWDEQDAEITDRSLADDVLWGSPFGVTVGDYHDLHDIHVGLKRQGVGGPRSRFEVVEVRAPAPDVAIAQVRRVAIDGEAGSFSELAVYVLVRRDDRWWVAAGHNTPIRGGSAPTDR